MKTLALVCAAVCLPLGAGDLPKILWRPPRAFTEQDWQCGPFGCDRAPAPPFHWVKEEMTGTEPKATVRDARGNTWSVKFGAEVIPECFAARFLPALGYVAEPTYCLARGRIQGVHGRLRRVARFIHRDGSFTRARFQLRGEKDFVYLDGQSWSWTDRSFADPHQLAGLKIVMMLLSNWDAKDARDGNQSNNSVFRAQDGRGEVLLYGVADWGASLGKWGGALRRDQSDCVGYSDDSPHIVRRDRAGGLVWGFSGKHARDLKAGVTTDDIRWLLPYLTRITEAQIRAALRASDATRRQSACWAGSIEQRIRELKAAAE
jgi:hypothetical protein